VHFVPSHPVPVLWVVSQALPQPPQFAVVLNEISHPSGCLFPLQSAYPVAQVPLQVLPAQVRVAMWLLEQLVAQPPQWLGSVWVLISQPSVSLSELQSA